MQFGKKLLSGILIAGILSFNVTTVYGLQIYVQPGDSLYKIAARYGTTVSSIMQSNGLRSTEISPGQALRIASNNGAPSSSVYTVRSGDTLFLIAQRFGISVDSLKQANNLSGNYLVSGSRLVIPVASSGSNSGATYRVKPGDTVYLIAKAYGISIDALRQANGLYSDQLAVGQNLRIPGSTGSNPGTPASTWNYTVKNGDTFYLIAQANGITVAKLLQVNQLASSALLYPGQVLKIPAAAPNTGNSSSKYNLNQSDINLLAKLVTAESDGETFEGQVAVAASILNRLDDPRYPKTIPGIVYQIVDGRYQYSPVMDGRIDNAATSSAYQAVNAALSGWDPSGGANGFYNPAKTESQWVKSQPITAVIGNHVFFSY